MKMMVDLVICEMERNTILSAYQNGPDGIERSFFIRRAPRE